MTKALLDEPTETMSPLPKDDPRLVAWEAYRAGPSYANTRNWALHTEHVDGSLWAAFVAGCEAMRSSAPQEPVVDDAETLIFQEAIKRGVDQDTADQIAQAVADRLQAKAPETGETP